MKGLKKLHTMKNVYPLNMEDMNLDQKHSDLQYLMLLINNRSGSIKERGFSDDRKQREYTKKEETYAPTVSMEALML